MDGEGRREGKECMAGSRLLLRAIDAQLHLDLCEMIQSTLLSALNRAHVPFQGQGSWGTDSLIPTHDCLRAVPRGITSAAPLFAPCKG